MNFALRINQGLVVFAAAAALISASAHPFSKQFVVVLNNITIDGDLSLPCPIARLAMDEKTSADIWLEHKLEVLDYGQARSIFVLHPFETGVYSLNSNSFVWLRPGGGAINFSDKPARYSNATHARPKLWQTMSANYSFRYYEVNGAELWISQSNQQVIREDGWELYHQNGELELIISKKGDAWKISSHGKRIFSITKENKQLAAMNWRDDLTPNILTVDDTTVHFECDAKANLREVFYDNEKLFSFTYDEKNLLRMADSPLLPREQFAWNDAPENSRRNSSYYLPFTLSRAGALRYEFESDKGVIHLRSFSNTALVGSLTIETLYGRIISVR